MPVTIKPPERLKHPDLIASVEALVATATRLNVVVAVAMVSDETQEMTAVGMCCPQHLCDLLRGAATAVELIEAGDPQHMN
jgi:hypothetical protein